MSEKCSLDKIKIPNSVMVKARSLLPMLYQAGELAAELSIAESTLQDWLGRGAPYLRDKHNCLWVYGWQFTAWVDAYRNPKTRRSPRLLKKSVGYCIYCNRVLEMAGPVERPIYEEHPHAKNERCVRTGTINGGGRHG